MYHIIVNPASRSGEGLQIWKEQVEPALLRQGIPYHSYFSKAAGDVARLTGEILAGNSGQSVSLIILGGDGTVNEALQGMEDTTGVVLGYIPTGSSNDLARDLQIPTAPLDALDLILHSGRERLMDLGTVTYENGRKRRFAVSCGIGYDAAICQEALHSRIKSVLNKLGLGRLTYLGVALKQLLGAKKISGKLLLDDGTTLAVENMLFTACMLHRFEGGGFMFCPDADDTDGCLDMCVVGDIPKLKVLLALPSAFKGKHYRYKGISACRAASLTIECSAPLWVHTDGEVERRSRKITVSCQREAIRIITR